MALSLDARLNAFNCTTELQEVKKTLDTAQPSVTFWGARVVELAGNDGSVYLDNIAEKVVRAASKHRDANNLTTNDRRIGVEIVQKLQTFYKVTDAQIKTLNFFTNSWSGSVNSASLTTRRVSISNRLPKGISSITPRQPRN